MLKELLGGAALLGVGVAAGILINERNRCSDDIDDELDDYDEINHDVAEEDIPDDEVSDTTKSFSERLDEFEKECEEDPNVTVEHF